MLIKCLCVAVHNHIAFCIYRVMKSDSHVLLYVYAPWCSYCKAFDSVYLELVAYFKHENNRHKNTMIARMDGTLNEIDHDAVRIVGYPTVIFFPINNKDFPVEYEGNRNFDDIVRFISDFSQ